MEEGPTVVRSEESYGEQLEPNSACGRRRKGAPRSAKSTTLRPQQQQVLQLQQHLHELLKQFNEAEVENTRLKDRLRVIEVVVTQRERQERLAQYSPACAVEQGPGRDASVRDSSPAVSSPVGSASYITASTASDHLDRRPADSGGLSTELEPSAAAPGPIPAALNPSGLGSVSGSFAFPQARGGGTKLQTSLQAGLPRPQSWASGTPQPELQLHIAWTRAGAGTGAGAGGDEQSATRWLGAWNELVRETALMVATYEARPSEFWVRRIEAVRDRLMLETQRMWPRAGAGLAVTGLRKVNLETGAEEVPPEGHWEEVARGMRPTPAQASACRAALALYRERMEVVMAQRRSLTNRLAACMGALRLVEANGRRATPGGQEQQTQSIAVGDVTAALDANVAAEGHVTGLARDLLRSNLFSPLQHAQGFILSHPYFPDALAIATAMVELHPPLPAGSSGSGGSSRQPKLA